MKQVKVICSCTGCGKEFELKETRSSRLIVKNNGEPTAVKESWTDELSAQYTVCKCGKVCLLQVDNIVTAQKLDEVRVALRSIAWVKKIGSDRKDTKAKLKTMFNKRNAELDMLRKQLQEKLTGKELYIEDSFYKGERVEPAMTDYKEVF